MDKKLKLSRTLYASGKVKDISCLQFCYSLFKLVDVFYGDKYVVTLINEIIAEAERENIASSHKFDSVKARLDSVVNILEEMIDLNDETLLTLYRK
uniref:Uncharacterized protein n=1 Tax=Amphimedon queenslandica TaxID=400682 RepID=A0A1X7SRR9_AMPQE